ncbi:hypothetical protein [Haladaptatus sp. CMSO5]|uniref:hypothetical protein n=1 Tax=Haladaptatus sp. CMSO5 TaxID=3120514 RepID=UPI002FCE0558
MTRSRRQVLTLLSVSLVGFAGCSASTPTDTDDSTQTPTTASTTDETPEQTTTGQWDVTDLQISNQTGSQITVTIELWERPFVEKEDPYETLTETRTPGPDEEPVFTDTFELERNGGRTYENLAAFDNAVRVSLSVEDGPSDAYSWRGDGGDSRGLEVTIGADHIEFQEYVA